MAKPLADRSGWRELARFTRPHARILTVAVALGLLGSGAALAQPLAVKWVIDTIGEQRSLLGPVALLGVLVVLGAALGAVQSFLLDRTAERIVLGARTGLASRLLSLRMAELDRRPPGELLSRVTSDTVLLRSVTTSDLVQAVNGAVSLVGALALMAVVDVVLLGATLVVLVVVAAALTLVLPKVRHATERGQQALAELSAALDRALGAVRTVRASGATDREIAVVNAAAGRAYGAGVAAARYNAVASISAGLAIQVSFLVVLGLGGARVAAGVLPVSSLVAFLLYLFYAAGPIASLVAGATSVQEGLAAVQRLREVQALPVEEGPAPGTPTAAQAGSPDAAGALVVLDRLSFRYLPAGPPVLDAVSFAVPRHGLVALVGPSGAGKSTIFALLERFYDPTSGRILLDGRDLQSLPREEVRVALGYVEQDAPVLAGTIGENLRYAAPAASDAALREALGQARLDEFVAGLPDGLDTVVGPRGVTLSGGQRQRIAIARALLRRPRLLLLDEATAQLDAVNEQALRDTVDEIARTRAVLVIAHRLSTVLRADAIVVLDHGRVRAIGTHEQLVAHDPLYAGLAATQVVDGVAGLDRQPLAGRGVDGVAGLDGQPLPGR